MMRSMQRSPTAPPRRRRHAQDYHSQFENRRLGRRGRPDRSREYWKKMPEYLEEKVDRWERR